MNFREPGRISPIPFEEKSPVPLITKEELLNRKTELLRRRSDLLQLAQPSSQATEEKKRLSILEISLIEQDLQIIEDSLDMLQKAHDPKEFNRVNRSMAQVETPSDALARIRRGEDGIQKEAISPGKLFESAAGVEVTEIDVDRFTMAQLGKGDFADTDPGTADIVLVNPRPIV